jgi:hypothetical protein
MSGALDDGAGRFWFGRGIGGGGQGKAKQGKTRQGKGVLDFHEEQTLIYLLPFF